MIAEAVGGGGWVAAGLAAAAAFGLVVMRRRYTVITVSGSSMNPTYADGDRLLVRRASARRISREQVVVFRMPPGHRQEGLRWLVKRAAAVPGDPVPADMHAVEGLGALVPPGRLLVRGDNPRSLDSRHFGYVPAGDVLGVAVRPLAVRPLTGGSRRG
ncbi:S26 family signal peptidase [Catenulispora yoronensis]|uniref:Mitochondrial inner membrane protease subunit 2 n=1 Tax=Catenulispora yoronensis TaxID=450799 RepID=A0ABN2U0M4_9ACTN